MGHEFNSTMAQFPGRETWVPQFLQHSRNPMVSISSRLAMAFHLFTIHHAAKPRSHPKCH